MKLRTLMLGGWSRGNLTRFFEEVTDLSVLRNCPRLKSGLIAGQIMNKEMAVNGKKYRIIKIIEKELLSHLDGIKTVFDGGSLILHCYDWQ